MTREQMEKLGRDDQVLHIPSRSVYRVLTSYRGPNGAVAEHVTLVKEPAEWALVSKAPRLGART